MILLSCFAAILFGFLIAHVAATVCKGLASIGTETWGYYFSGYLFSVSLAFPPALALGLSDTFRTSWARGLSEQFLFKAVFALSLSSFLYLVVAHSLRITAYNRIVLGTVTVLATGGIAFAFHRGNNGFADLTLVTLVIALMPTQVALSKIHQNFEPD